MVSKHRDDINLLVCASVKINKTLHSKPNLNADNIKPNLQESEQVLVLLKYPRFSPASHSLI